MTEKQVTQRTRVQRTSLSDAIELMQNAPPKKDEYSLRQSVFKMRVSIESMLAKGYNYDEIAQMLAKTDIDIKGATLRQYMTTSRSKKRTKKATTLERSQGNQQNQAETPDDAQQTVVAKQELRNTSAQVTNPSRMVEVSNRSRKTTEDEFNDY